MTNLKSYQKPGVKQKPLPLSSIPHETRNGLMRFAAPVFAAVCRRMRELFAPERFPVLVIEFWGDLPDGTKQRFLYEGCYFTGSSNVDCLAEPSLFTAQFKIFARCKDGKESWVHFQVTDRQIICLSLLETFGS